MPTTPTYSLPYQSLTDAPHGPDLGRLLAEAVEAQIARLDGLITAQPKLVAWVQRTTSTVAGAGPTGVMRLNAALTAGRMYRIMTNHVGVDQSVSGQAVRLVYNYRTDGVNAGTADTIMTMTQLSVPAEAVGEYTQLDQIYVPGGSQTISVMLTISRPTASGNVQVVAGTGGVGVVGPAQLSIWDIGPAIAQTGAVI